MGKWQLTNKSYKSLKSSTSNYTKTEITANYLITVYKSLATGGHYKTLKYFKFETIKLKSSKSSNVLTITIDCNSNVNSN